MAESANACSAEFDSAVTRTGRLTLKLSTLDATGRGNVRTQTSTSIADLNKYSIRVKGSTKYKLSVWAKTNNVATNSVYFTSSEFDSLGASIA